MRGRTLSALVMKASSWYSTTIITLVIMIKHVATCGDEFFVVVG